MLVGSFKRSAPMSMSTCIFKEFDTGVTIYLKGTCHLTNMLLKVKLLNAPIAFMIYLQEELEKMEKGGK